MVLRFRGWAAHRSLRQFRGIAGSLFDSFMSRRVDTAAKTGVLYDEASVDRPGNLREGLESGEGVLHEEDRPQGAFLDAEIRVSRPRRNDGREGRFPDAVAADAGVGPRNRRGPAQDDRRDHGHRIPDEQPGGNPRGPEGEG